MVSQQGIKFRNPFEWWKDITLFLFFFNFFFDNSSYVLTLWSYFFAFFLCVQRGSRPTKWLGSSWRVSVNTIQGSTALPSRFIIWLARKCGLWPHFLASIFITALPCIRCCAAVARLCRTRGGTAQPHTLGHQPILAALNHTHLRERANALSCCAVALAPYTSPYISIHSRSHPFTCLFPFIILKLIQACS